MVKELPKRMSKMDIVLFSLVISGWCFFTYVELMIGSYMLIFVALIFPVLARTILHDSRLPIFGRLMTTALFFVLVFFPLNNRSFFSHNSDYVTVVDDQTTWHASFWNLPPYQNHGKVNRRFPNDYSVRALTADGHRLSATVSLGALRLAGEEAAKLLAMNHDRPNAYVTNELTKRVDTAFSKAAITLSIEEVLIEGTLVNTFSQKLPADVVEELGLHWDGGFKLSDIAVNLPDQSSN